MMSVSKESPPQVRIRAAAERDALSHALLLTGGGEKERLETARFAAAAMECAAEQGRPCGRCGPSRKVHRDIHPDVITVRDPEHKQFSGEAVRAGKPLKRRSAAVCIGAKRSRRMGQRIKGKRKLSYDFKR